MKAEIGTLLEGYMENFCKQGGSGLLESVGQWLKSQRNSDESLSSVFPSMPFFPLTLLANYVSVFACIHCGKWPWKLLRQLNIQHLTQKVKLIFSSQNSNLWGRKCIRPAWNTCSSWPVRCGLSNILERGFRFCAVEWDQGASSQLCMHQSPCNDCVHRRAGEFLEKRVCVGKLNSTKKGGEHSYDAQTCLCMSYRLEAQKSSILHHSLKHPCSGYTWCTLSFTWASLKAETGWEWVRLKEK